MEFLVLNGTSVAHSSPRLRGLHRRENRKIIKARGSRKLQRNSGLWSYQDCSICKLKATSQFLQDLLKHKQDQTFSTEGRKVDTELQY